MYIFEMGTSLSILCQLKFQQKTMTRLHLRGALHTN